MFHESLKKTFHLEFNVKTHCEINVKLVFHEILRKKIFSVSFPLPYGTNCSCKDYLLFAIILFDQVFLLSQIFSGMFCG